jgi:hypothetical protein
MPGSHAMMDVGVIEGFAPATAAGSPRKRSESGLQANGAVPERAASVTAKLR